MEQQVQQQAVISKPLLTVSFCLFQKEQDATRQVELEKTTAMENGVALLCILEVTESEELILQLRPFCSLSSH